MRRSIVVVLSCAVLACGSDEPLAPGIDPGVAGDGQLEEVLEVVRSILEIPSLGAMLVHEGQIVETGAVGVRVQGGPEVTTADRWHLGSLTKAMTSTVAGVVVEQGLIDWSTTVADVFPDLVGQILSDYEDVRLDELLAHVTGLRFEVEAVPSWPDIEAGNGTLTELRRQWAAELMMVAPEVPRGRFLFTDAGYIVAAAMLEEVTGEAFEDLMQAELFEPLGMVEAGFGPPGTAGMQDQPWGHEATPGGLLARDPGSPEADDAAAYGPARTVNASLEAYAQFVIAQLEGARGGDNVVTAETYEKIQTEVGGNAYALGWGVGVRDFASGIVFQHEGTNLRWYTTAWLAPERDAAMVAVTNAGGTAALLAINEAIVALIGRFEAAEGPGTAQ